MTKEGDYERSAVIATEHLTAMATQAMNEDLAFDVFISVFLSQSVFLASENMKRIGMSKTEVNQLLSVMISEAFK